MKHHHPRRRFGQHFLVDERVIHQIIEVIDPQPGDLMVEIGPGLGALTSPLLKRLERLHVVELDRDIVSRLQETYPVSKLVIHAGDALDFDFSALGPGLRVVGNLPYNISTPLLFHILRNGAVLRDVHVMLQKEVVARIVARPGTAQYGRLSVMLQCHFDAQAVLEVSPPSFRPPPKVISAFVRMAPRRVPVVCSDEVVLGQVTRAAFSRRRKTLRNALKTYLEPHEFEALGLTPQARPQEVSVESFVAIANYIGARNRRASIAPA